jgi:hypothetical protein
VTVRRSQFAILVVAIMSAAPGATSAQTVIKYSGLLTPHTGVTTGDDAEDPGFTYGVSLAVVDRNGWGAELDVAHATTVGNLGFGDTGLTSGLLHVLYISPRGVVRPFGVVGAGLMRLSGIRQADGDTSRTDWAFSLGGGVHVPMTELLSIRGDVRYQRFFERHPDVQANVSAFGVWRLSAGLTFDWPMEP